LGRTVSVQELLATLEAEILLDDGWLRDEVTSVIASDLMSDILSHSKPRSILLTGLTNPQTIRTAEMIEISAVCFIQGKQPHEETVKLAQKNQIPLLSSPLSMFDACGKLYAAGLSDCNDTL
jgi:hypothetical protein